LLDQARGGRPPAREVVAALSLGSSAISFDRAALLKKTPVASLAAAGLGAASRAATGDYSAAIW